MRQVLLAVAAMAIAQPLAGQSKPNVTAGLCGAAVCDEQAIYTAAVDTALRAIRATGFRVEPPRILSTVHLSPFRRLDGTLTPPVDRFHAGDWRFLSRIWPGTQVVDSASVVGPDGVSLRPGGVLIIIAPITWLGPHAARVRLAAYYTRVNYGEERYIFLEHREQRWHVVRMEFGYQN